jgi:alkylated DNA nucleotide flippase Atl1
LPPRRKWSAKTLAPAAAALKSGATYGEAGALIGISAAAATMLAVRGLLPRSTQTWRPPSARVARRDAGSVARLAKIQRWIDDEHLTASRVAKRLGVSRQRVSQWKRDGKLVFTIL